MDSLRSGSSAFVWGGAAISRRRTKLHRISEANVAVTNIQVLNETDASEALTIITEAAVRFPDLLKEVKQVTLLKYHDARELRRGGESKAIYGSFSSKPTICSGGGISLSTFHEDLPAGRYLIVYRLQALDATLHAIGL